MVSNPESNPAGDRSAETHSDRHTAQNGNTASEAFQDAQKHLGELKEYISYFISAKTDAWKASLRNLGIYAVLGVIGLAVGITFICASVVMLLDGIAGGLGVLFGRRPWLGQITVGLVVVLILAGVAIFAIRGLPAMFHRQMLQKYEKMRKQQRTRYGRDVSQAAAKD